MKRLELAVDYGDYAGKRLEVGKDGLRLGRSSSNDIAIADEELSRNHCFFEQSGDAGIRLTDLASANGTYLNGERLEGSAELKAGDEISVGGVLITVVGEGLAPGASNRKGEKVDLGLDTGAMDRDALPTVPARARRRTLVNCLWVFALLVLAASVLTILWMPGEEGAAEREMEPRKEELLELSYEKVVGGTNSIFRYAVSLRADGTLAVAMDDLAGEGRHVNRSAKIRDGARETLLEALQDPGFAALDGEYVGPDEEPPKLDSSVIRFLTTESVRSVKVVNAAAPEAFRRVCEKLKAFSMNELGIRALEYSRDQLIAMARDAGGTARMKWEDRDVEYGNLHAAIRAYREAIANLETVNPKPPEYEDYRAGKAKAEAELKTRYGNQRFAVEQATSVGDWEKARSELKILCEMIPDRDDDRNREASAKLIDVERRIGKKGGAR